ncbi:MAG: hypothetical protein ABI972_08005 [Acidobacteriota bacterium]
MTYRHAIPTSAALAVLLLGCGASETPSITGSAITGQPVGSSSAPAPQARPASSSGFVEGQDYVILSRVRFLDQMGFDQPVEAFSMLFPKGWRTEGGVKWGSIGGCRGELIANPVKATSPDGAFQFQAFPGRSFQSTDDQFLMQTMQAGAQAGGCQVNRPFNAQQYVEGFARRDLQAQVANVRIDEANMAPLRQVDQQFNSNGGSSQRESTRALGDVTFPDGAEGILQGVVVNLITRQPNYMGGGATTTTGTIASSYLMRCPAGRRDECMKLMTVIMTSHRVSPIWSSAKERFLTQLGNMEHAQSMERIRLMGEQSKAYAQAQSAASDQRMRDWENRQSSQDQQHKNFVQTIREVETWKDASGSVELSSGYSQAWSRGDGSYVLSNKAGFDPSSAFQDQAWKPMQRGN